MKNPEAYLESLIDLLDTSNNNQEVASNVFKNKLDMQEKYMGLVPDTLLDFIVNQFRPGMTYKEGDMLFKKYSTFSQGGNVTTPTQQLFGIKRQEVNQGDRTNYGTGGITLNKQGPYKDFYAITLDRGGKSITFRDKDKSVVEEAVKEFEATRPPRGGASIKIKRKVEGVSEENLIKLREIITNKAKERGLPKPNFEEFPGRGYPSDTPGNIMAKDLIRGIKKTGTRGGKDFKTVGTGSGSKALTDPLSKPEKQLLENYFTDVDFNYNISKFGIDREVNPKLYQKAVDLVREKPKLFLGFQFMKPENYLLTQFQRARLQQLADFGVSKYVPIYKNQKIIGFQDNTEAGMGKKFYHVDYKGGPSIKTHSDFEKVNKYVDIVKNTKNDHIPILNKLFTEAGEKVPTFNELLNGLLDSPSRSGPGTLSTAIEKHHTKRAKISTADLQLLTRDQNKLAALIEGRVDAGRMDFETAGKILKPMGIQIERDGVKIGAPDIDPEKQVQDLKKWVQRKTLEKFATPEGRLAQKKLVSSVTVQKVLKQNGIVIPGCGRIQKNVGGRITFSNGSCGGFDNADDFAKGDPENFLKTVQNDPKASKLMRETDPSNLQKILKSVVKDTKSPFGFIGGDIIISTLFGAGALEEGKTGLEASDAALWFLPREVLDAYPKALTEGYNEKDAIKIRRALNLEIAEKNYFKNKDELDNFEKAREEKPELFTAIGGQQIKNNVERLKNNMNKYFNEADEIIENFGIRNIPYPPGEGPTGDNIQEYYEDINSLLEEAKTKKTEKNVNRARSFDLGRELQKKLNDILMPDVFEKILGKGNKDYQDYNILGEKSGIFTDYTPSPARLLAPATATIGRLAGSYATTNLPYADKLKNYLENIAISRGKENLVNPNNITQEQYDAANPQLFYSGGIAGLSGGVKSGIAPRRGPNPQGLASLKEYDKQY
jgi:hypothetical protein